MNYYEEIKYFKVPRLIWHVKHCVKHVKQIGSKLYEQRFFICNLNFYVIKKAYRVAYSILLPNILTHIYSNMDDIAFNDVIAWYELLFSVVFASFLRTKRT